MSTAEDPNNSTLQPGQTIRPYVPDDVVKELVETIYGMQVISYKELNSYDDKNFHVKISEENVDNPYMTDVSPHGYVLKVLNSMDSHKTNYIDGQNEMMLFLNSKGFNCPQPIKSKKGELKTTHKIYKEGTEEWKENNLIERPYGVHLVRLLTFVTGKILYEIPYTGSIFYQMGQYVARMDNSLEAFHHTAYDTHETIWSLESVPRLMEFTYAIRDEDNKRLVQEVVETFKEKVAPNYPKMKKGLLHGDFNEQNIIVRPKTKSDDEASNKEDYEVAGVLDFGDSHISYYLFEVALTITYGMLESDTVDIFDVGGHVLAGYTSVRDFSEQEIKLLKYCIAARYAQSLGMGEYTYSLDPGNEYLLTTAKNGWPQLRKLWAKDVNELCTRWQEIRKLYETS